MEFKKLNYWIMIHRYKVIDNPKILELKKREEILEIIKPYIDDLASEIVNDLEIEMNTKGCKEASLETLHCDPFLSWIISFRNIDILAAYGYILGNNERGIEVSFNGYIR